MPADVKKTLVINYPQLHSGGIEVSLAALIKHSLNNGIRVIWITNHGSFKKVIDSKILGEDRLEIVFHEKINKILSVPEISFGSDEHVIMITCRALQYVVSERIKAKAHINDFKHFLIVAHFTGDEYYPDRCFKIGQRFVYRFYRRILQRVVRNDCLRAFQEKHLECYEEYYKLMFPNKNRMVLDKLTPEETFDFENTLTRSKERKDCFIITTCARFDFPHKGYLIGLIDEFARLKPYYKQIKLQIVGYGMGKTMLEEKINNLNDGIKKDIYLLGALPHDDLMECYKKSHLVIGLAGAVSDGARSGIPSLVVRHYSYNCEAFGFYFEASEKVLDEEPGDDIIPFIEKCITMNNADYISIGRYGYETVIAKKIYNPNYFFQQENAKNNITVKYPYEAIVGRILYVYSELKDKMKI